MASDTFSYEDALKPIPSQGEGDAFSYEDALKPAEAFELANKSEEPQPEEKKGFVSSVIDTVKGAGKELVENPEQAALAGGSAAAESYGSLKGGEILSHALSAGGNKFEGGVNKMIAKGLGKIPRVGPFLEATAPAVLGMAEFAGGSALTHAGIKKGEEALGISNAIDRSQAANPNISTTAGTAVMGGMAAKSIKGYKALAAEEGVGTALGHAAKSAVGGAAFPYIDYGARKGINTVAGEGTVEEIPVPTGEDVLHSARDMAVLGGMGYKAGTKKPTPELEKVPSEARTLPEEQITGSSEDILGKAEADLAVANEKVAQAADAADQSDSSETAAALREDLAAPVTPKKAAPAAPAAPEITAAAQTYAEANGIDLSQVPANKYGKISKADVQRWVKAQAATKVSPVEDTTTPPEPITPDENTQTPQQQGAPTSEAEPDIAASGEVSPTPEIASGKSEIVAPESYLPEPISAKEGAQQGEQQFIEAVQQKYPDEFTSDILQSLYRAKDSEEFTEWAKTHYPEIAKDPSIAQGLYEEIHALDSELQELLDQSKKDREVEANNAAASSASLGIDDPRRRTVTPPEPPSGVTEIPAALPTGEVLPVAGSQGNRVAEVKNIRPRFPKGAAARTFVSPNTAEGLTLDQAVENLAGKQHTDLASVIDRATETLPVNLARGKKEGTSRSDALGTWSDNGAENSFILRHNGDVDEGSLRATAALLGAHGEQKQALIFRKSDGGKDVMYEFVVPELSPKETSQYLEQWAKENGYENGFGFRTLESEGGGTRVSVVNKIPGEGDSGKEFTETKNKVKQFTNQHELTRDQYLGTAEFLGDPNGTDRDVARNHYSETIRQYLARRGGLDGDSPDQSEALDLDHRYHRHRIWELAQEIGLDVGDRPEGLSKEAAERAQEEEARKNDAGTLSSAEIPPEKIAEAEAGIPADRRAEYDRVLIEAHDRLTKLSTSGGYSGYLSAVREMAINRAFDHLRIRIASQLAEDPTANLESLKLSTLVQGALSNSIEVIQNRVKSEMAYGEVEHARSGFSDESDTQSDLGSGEVDSVREDSGSADAYSPAEKEAVFQKIADKATPVADKIALGHHLLNSGSLERVDQQRLIKLLPEQKSISSDDLLDSNAIYENHDLDEIMRGEHRDENGEIRNEEGVLRRAAQKPPGKENVEKNLLREMDGTELVQRVLAHKNSTPLQRKIAQILLGNKALDKIAVGIFDRLNPGSEAEYHPDKHAIAISREQTEGEINPQTSLHEIFHALTKAFFHPDNRAILTEPQKTAVQGIKDLFRQARFQAEKLGLTSKEKYQIFDKEPERAFEEHELDHYGWSDVDEFISEAMTNERFQDQLRQIDVRNSVSGKKTTAWDLFKNTVRMLMGLPRPDNSALSKAVDHILELSMSETPIGFGENGEVLRGRAYKESEVLRSLTIKPKLALNKTVGSLENVVSPEDSRIQYASGAAQAKEALVRLFSNEQTRTTNARGGVSVNFANPDHRMVEKLGNPYLNPLEARVIHALGDRTTGYRQASPDKIRTAPLVLQTVRSADLAGDLVLNFDEYANELKDSYRDHQKSKFFLKLYNDSESPTGVRWHTVLTDKDGNFITQWSSPTLGSREASGTVTASGDRTPTAKKESGDGRRNQGVVRNLIASPEEAGPNPLEKESSEKLRASKEKISALSEEEALSRAVELQLKQEAGTPLDESERAEQAALEQDPRFGGSSEPETLKRPATKKTTALDDQEKSLSPELQKALGDTSYVPFKWKEDAASVAKWLSESAATPGTTWEKMALDLTSEEPIPGVSERQKTVGKFMLTKSLDNAASELRKAGKVYEAARYNKLAKTLFKAAKLDASAYGQGLNTVKMLTELVSGNTALSEYVDPISKVHYEKLAGRGEVADILGTLKGSMETGADTTVAKSTPLLEKLVNGKSATELGRIVKEALLNPDSTPESLTVEIAEAAGVSPEKAAPAAEAIRKVFTLEARKSAKAELDKLVKNAEAREERAKIKKIVDSDSDKLMRLIGMGAMSEEKYYNAIAKTYGLPSWDPTFAKFVEKEGDKISALPESMKDYRQQKTQRLMGEIAKKVRTEKLNNKDAGEIADLLTTFWQLGVLSGPPTQVVNAVASGISVLGESLAEGLGAMRKTGDSKHLVEVFSGFLQAVTGKGGAKSLVAQEFSRALKEGTSKYKNSKGETLSSMETLPDAKDLQGAMKLVSRYGNALKYVGRSMAAFDAANMAMAESAAERKAARLYLHEEKGLEGDSLENAMKDLFDPQDGVVEKYRAQAKQEVAEGHYADETPADQNRWVERRVNELLSQRRDQLTGGGISERAIQAAERFTYNDDARGILGQFAGFMNQINQETKVSKFVISFMKTMMNLVNQSIDWSPYGFLRGANKSFSQTRFKEGSRFDPVRYEEGSAEQYAEYARATLGTIAWVGLAYLAYKGLEDEKNGGIPTFSIHGSGPSNPYDKQQLIATRNWQPNSIRIGNHWLRYTDWPVLGIALGGMGSFFDSQRYAKDDSTTQEKLFAGAMATASTVLDKNMLQGVSNLFEGIRQSSNTAQQANALKRLVSGAVGGFTNPGLARWARNSFYADKNGMVNRLDQSTTEGWAYSMVPFSIGYNTPALNTLGEPLQQPWYSATMWRFADVNGVPPHPIITPLVKAGMMLPNPSKNTEFRYVDKTGAVQKTRTGKYPEINRRYVELRGQALKEMLTPEVIGDLSRAAKENVNEAQTYLDSKIGGAARKYAIAQIEQEIQEGKLVVK